MAPPGKATQKNSVLIVEDDAFICKLLKVVLDKKGFAVEQAESYAAATGAIERMQARLIILDLGLPDGDGLDLLRWLREDLHRTDPVIVLTAFRQEEKAVKAFQLGADDFISKPFAPNVLIERIERILRGSVDRRP